jgi:hypothetical protein
MGSVLIFGAFLASGSGMSLRLYIAVLLACVGSVHAQPKGDEAPAVVVTALRNPVAKSYRRIVAGMERFEKRHHLAPAAALRFKLLPRHRDTKMEDVEVEIVGDSVTIPVEVARDHTFVLERHRVALKEDAAVMPNRKARTMTWRAEIRTPGLPPNTRRLGDLRLECEVGMTAGLISNHPANLFARLLELVPEGPEYCGRPAPRYLFFAERALFSVALVSGARRQVLPVDMLYAGASRDPQWKEGLPYCDCEVLVDRAYFLPLGDRSWPDETLVEFEYMEERQ